MLVPVGARTITGCVIGTDEAAGDDPRAVADGLRDIIDLLDGEPYLPADVVALAGWVADYYACGPGEVVGAAVPPMAWLESRRVVAITEEGSRAVAGGPGPPLSALARRVLETAAAARSLPESTLRTRLNRTAAGAAGTRPPLAYVLGALERSGLLAISQVLEGEAVAYKTERIIELTAQGREAAGRADAAGLRLGARQRELLTALAAAPAGLSAPALRERGFDVAGLRRLGLRDLVSIRRQAVERDPFAGPWGRTGQAAAKALEVTLTAEQDAALERLRRRLDEGAFRVALVHGVTGSGKTELYARLAEHTLRTGRRALVLVPEIALTLGVAAAFRSAVRRPRGHPAQRPVRRRAPRPVAAHPPRRHRRGRRHPVGRLRAAPGYRPHRRRRGARRVVQTGREPALQRPRRRHRPRAGAAGAGGARVGDALDGIVRAREAGPV